MNGSRVRANLGGLVACVALVACHAGPVPAVAAPDPVRSSDLRPRFTAFGLAPRSQGPRPTCSIFTTAAALEFAYAVLDGRGERLSPEYLNWAANAAMGRADDGDFFHCALAGYARFGICAEEACPYAAAFTGAPPSADALVDGGRHLAHAGARLVVRWIRPIGQEPRGLTPAQLEEVVRTLAAGFPVAAGSAHSRLLVGYRDDPAAPGGGVFLTLDSALAAWSEVTAAYVRDDIADAFTVEVVDPGPDAPQSDAAIQRAAASRRSAAGASGS